VRRRGLLRAGAGLAGATLLAPLLYGPRASAAGAYGTIDSARLRRAFAPPAQAPQLLLAFARWLDAEAPPGLPLADGLSGDDGRWTSRFNDFWIEEGADLSEQFATFLAIGDGGDVALWNREGGPSAQWPVVLIGGEGEAVVLADSFAGFLARLATAQFDEPGAGESDGFSWSEFQTDAESDGEEAEADTEARAGLAAAHRARKALGEWLREQTGRDDLAALARRRVPHDALRRFFDAHLNAVHERQRASADWRALRALVQQGRPTGYRGSYDDLHVVCAGDFFRIGTMSGRDRRFVPHARSGELEPPIRALREERARRFPAHGLWFHARLRVYTADTVSDPQQPGLVDLVAQYLDDASDLSWLPRPPATAVRADCARAPRSAWWTPDWLRAILAASP
jgi:hypothetical protein